MKPFVKCDNIISYIKKTHFPEYAKNINAYEALKDRVLSAIATVVPVPVILIVMAIVLVISLIVIILFSSLSFFFSFSWLSISVCC